MAAILIGGAVIGGLGTAVVAGTGAYTYYKYKKRAALKDNMLFGVPLTELHKCFLTEDDIPYVVSFCCEELENRTKDKKIDWIKVIEECDYEIVEQNDDLLVKIGMFSTHKLSKQRQVHFNDTSEKGILEILFYYLSNIPDSICSLSQFKNLAELQKWYRQDAIDSWSTKVVDILFELPTKHRLTLNRVIRLFYWIVGTFSDDVDKNKFLNTATTKLLQCVLSAQDLLMLAAEETGNLGPDSLEEYIKNYSTIASACSHRKLCLQEELTC